MSELNVMKYTESTAK